MVQLSRGLSQNPGFLAGVFPRLEIRLSRKGANRGKNFCLQLGPGPLADKAEFLSDKEEKEYGKFCGFSSKCN